MQVLREKDIDSRIVRYGRERYRLCVIKLTTLGPVGVSGYPDRLFLGPKGKVIFMEMKAPGRECTELQLVKQGELRALGFKVFVVDDVSAGRRILDIEFGGRKRTFSMVNPVR